MKIRCTDIIPVLTEGGKLTPEMEGHLRNCPDCAFLRTLGENPVEEQECDIPEALDRTIREAARKHLAAAKWKVWKIAVPIAASFAVCFGILFYTVQPGRDVSKIPSPTQTASSWGTSDFDENMFALSCDAAGGVSAFNLYDSM